MVNRLIYSVGSNLLASFRLIMMLFPGLLVLFVGFSCCFGVAFIALVSPLLACCLILVQFVVVPLSIVLIRSNFGCFYLMF